MRVEGRSGRLLRRGALKPPSHRLEVEDVHERGGDGDAPASPGAAVHDERPADDARGVSRPRARVRDERGARRRVQGPLLRGFWVQGLRPRLLRQERHLGGDAVLGRRLERVVELPAAPRFVGRQPRPLQRRDVERVRVRERLAVGGAPAVDEDAADARRRHRRHRDRGVAPRRRDIAEHLRVAPRQRRRVEAPEVVAKAPGRRAGPVPAHHPHVRGVRGGRGRPDARRGRREGRRVRPFRRRGRARRAVEANPLPERRPVAARCLRRLVERAPQEHVRVVVSSSPPPPYTKSPPTTPAGSAPAAAAATAVPARARTSPGARARAPSPRRRRRRARPTGSSVRATTGRSVRRPRAERAPSSSAPRPRGEPPPRPRRSARRRSRRTGGLPKRTPRKGRG